MLHIYSRLADELSMCVVGQACDVGWAEDPPTDSECPPCDAANAAGQSLFRLVTTIPPTSLDFLSRRGLNPDKHFTDHSECTNVALSIWTTAEKCSRQRRFSSMRERLIAKVVLLPGSGAIRNRGAGHFSWWRCGAFDAIGNSSPVN